MPDEDSPAVLEAMEDEGDAAEDESPAEVAAEEVAEDEVTAPLVSAALVDEEERVPEAAVLVPVPEDLEPAEEAPADDALAAPPELELVVSEVPVVDWVQAARDRKRTAEDRRMCSTPVTGCGQKRMVATGVSSRAREPGPVRVTAAGPPGSSGSPPPQAAGRPAVASWQSD